jgi:hypothetical protein
MNIGQVKVLVKKETKKAVPFDPALLVLLVGGLPNPPPEGA